MLTYIINVTGDLLTASVVAGVAFAFIDKYCNDIGRLIMRIGLLLGLIAAGVRAYITNTRRLVGGWKVGAYGYGISLALFALLSLAIIVLFFTGCLKKSAGPRRRLIRSIALSVITALLISSYCYTNLPNVYVYPFKFDTGGNGMLSTEYLFKLGGYLIGLIICLLSLISAAKITSVAMEKGITKLPAIGFYLLNLLFAVYNFARLMLVLTPRKIIDSIELFNFGAKSNNNSEYYTYAAFLVVLILALIIWVKSFTAKEPYRTNAEHRKQRAVFRTGRRYSVLALICLIAGILSATWFVKLNTVVIREAPVEDALIVKDGAGNDSTLVVPFDSVNDGHLHRFGYKTSGGKLVRFIVVQKQAGTNNYGIGLDACEICGEAGYYENKDGQVVCKKCNVVMNKTTIGMKGGCNPIIIDYDINEGNIIVPVEELVNNENHF